MEFENIWDMDMSHMTKFSSLIFGPGYPENEHCGRTSICLVFHNLIHVFTYVLAVVK